MKIIVRDEKEFEDIVEMSKYLHDFCYWKNTSFNWKFWQWIPERSIFNQQGQSLDFDKYPGLLLLAHLYRIKHAHLEGGHGSTSTESEFLKKTLYIENK